MIATSQPPDADSLSRLLYDSYFENVKVIMPSGLWQEEGMKNAREGTLERMLWEQVDEMVAMKIEASSVGIIVKLFYDKIKPRKSVAALDRKICSVMKSWA